MTGNFVSSVGNHVHIAVASWVMFRLTRSSAMVGVLSVAGQAPTILLTIPAGLVADAWNRRRLLMGVYTIQMMVAAGLAAVVLAGALSPAVLVAVTVAMGVLHTLGGPGWIALITEVVPSERAMTAFALNSVSFHTAAAAGPVVGAALFASVGAGVAFGFNAATFVAVLLGLLAVRPAFAVSRASTGVRRSLQEIVVFARGSQRVRRLVPASGAIAILALGLPAILPAYASGVLGGRSGTFGLLMGVYGAGSLSGAIVLGLLSLRSARRTIMILGAWAVAIGAILLAVRSHPTAFAGVWLVGGGQLMFLVTSRTVIQLDAPEALRARAVSLWFVVVVGLGPAGGLLLGWLSDASGLPATLAGSAVYGVVVALALTRTARGRGGMVRPYVEEVAGGEAVGEASTAERSQRPGGGEVSAEPPT